AKRLELELKEEDCVDLSVCSWIFRLYYKYDPTQIYRCLQDICQYNIR
ncbi:hypothetical protein V498_08246, partial [Pseudogymnoascus sp. VKM F-4517 (FW-2822)]